MTPTTELALALSSGSYLLESSSPPSSSPDLKIILKERLLSYYRYLGSDHALQTLQENLTLEDVQTLTAREALSVVDKVQKILEKDNDTGLPDADPDADATPTQAPLIGTRDLTKLRTLLALIFKWGTEPILGRVSLAWPSTHHRAGDGIVDQASISGDFTFLSSLVTSLMSLIFPQGVQGHVSQTLITTTILGRHAADLLQPSIGLGWLPESFSCDSTPTLHEVRPLVLRFLRLLSAPQTISALGGILSSSPVLHVRKTCAALLTKQLLRPDGISGLFEVMFSEEEASGDEVEIEKLDHIARTLLTVPVGKKAECQQEYYHIIIPRVINFLSSNMSTPRRAAAFTVYRAVVPEKTSPNQILASSIILTSLQNPLLGLTVSSQESLAATSLKPSKALSSIVTLFSNTEPSSVFISRMLSPILPSIYLLSHTLNQFKTSDPQLKQTVDGLLTSWGKIIDRAEGTNVLWSIMEGGKAGEWEFNTEGLSWSPQSNREPDVRPILMPKDMQATEVADHSDVDTNLFDLYPDPVHFVEFLKMIDREDVASELFVKLLENYRDMKTHLKEDALKILHQLQIIMQMQKKLSEGTASNILRKPAHLLSFVSHVLDSVRIFTPGSDSSQGTHRGGADADDKFFDEDDSDDEAPDSEPIGPDDELIETAINLLLAILEANEKLLGRDNSVFNEIFSKLEPLALNGSSNLRPLAREARLVITARLANESGIGTTTYNGNSEENGQETYQKALKLLQDPILPVRAHGLLLLRQLVTTSSSSSTFKGAQFNNRSLLPSVLSIFLQSVQDDDSYIYMNAVQGLAAMVDMFGKEVLQGLLRDYSGGLVGLGVGNLSQQDVDTRTRVGEALSSIIKRCGSALGIYVDMIVPPLYAMIRAPDIPTALRTSSLSLLADCVDVYPLAMLPFVEDLCRGMVDLLQIETVPIVQVAAGVSKDASTQSSDEHHVPEQLPQAMDSDPTVKNSKLPPLRRAALHFLTLLIRATIKQIYDQLGSGTTLYFPRILIQRTNVTLGYLSASDEDGIVRLMANEAKELLKQLQQAMLDL
ncbi:hypothetical protein B0H34DRAFT_793763 [Crassisporium funariophilum]|nr:hypothetical protein B0H34DRAFT_793763 [Crassisporium funariophilum]